MDMIDLSQVMELLKIDPGHGLIQSLLLFLIWLSSRGVRKEIAMLSSSFEALKESLLEHKHSSDDRFMKIESRLTLLEQHKGA